MRFKSRWFVLAVAIAACVAITAQAASAVDWNEYSGSSPSPSYGSPWFGTDFYAGVYHHDGTNNSNDSYEVSIGVGADYTTYPTSWAYPTPGIGANWLRARVALQYDDNHDGVPDGNCGTYDTYNAAGVYSAYRDVTVPLRNTAGGCYHPWVRGYTRADWNAGGLGAHEKEFIDTAWRQNWAWWCAEQSICDS